MKTVQEIKDEVARHHGFNEWADLIAVHYKAGFTMAHLNDIIDNAMKAYAEEALMEAAERANVQLERITNWETVPRTKEFHSEKYFSNMNEMYTVDKSVFESLIEEIKAKE
jgi:hypothetical protein